MVYIKGEVKPMTKKEWTKFCKEMEQEELISFTDALVEMSRLDNMTVEEVNKEGKSTSKEEEEEQRMLRFALRESKVEFLKMWSQEEFDNLWKKLGGYLN